MGKQWSAPTDFATVCRRAAGRRRYHARRQAAARARCRIVFAVALTPEWLKRGGQARLARELGVHRSTISRDVAKWKRLLVEVARLMNESAPPSVN